MISLGFLITSLFISSLHADEINLLKLEDFRDPIAEDTKVKEFSIVVKHQEFFYSFMDGEPYYASDMVAAVEVEEAADLKDYAVVQYIRGCHYNTTLENGEIKYRLGTSREFFGSYLTFKHPEWVLDSTDSDPVYWSQTEIEGDRDYGRTGLYRLDNPHESQYRSQFQFFYRDHKDQKKYFIQDSPSGADYNGELLGHSNVSLEFKTCLFRHENVPLISDPSGKAIASEALKCFYWQSSFQYNYEMKRYQIEDEIHPFCKN